LLICRSYDSFIFLLTAQWRGNLFPKRKIYLMRGSRKFSLFCGGKEGTKKETRWSDFRGIHVNLARILKNTNGSAIHSLFPFHLLCAPYFTFQIQHCGSDGKNWIFPWRNQEIIALQWLQFYLSVSFLYMRAFFIVTNKKKIRKKWKDEDKNWSEK
jgi:hypothetical protein